MLSEKVKTLESVTDVKKRILLLGGSAQQVIAIEISKCMGYETVLCDYLEDNPGQYVADKFYLTSTTDKEAVLHIAQEEKVSGILAYASDPAAPTAAYVAEQLGLPTNPYISVETLCNKDRFRSFLNTNGFNSPKSIVVTHNDVNTSDINKLKLPFIVKPTDSSGSKGVTIIHNTGTINAAIDYALSFSKKRSVLIEEYIEMKHSYLIGGDIFVRNGIVILWGLMNCHRDPRVNKLVPVGKSFPIDLSDDDVERVRETLQRLVTSLGFKNGPMNVELIIDKKNQVWPIDIGPRSGGNMIPDALGDIFGVNIVKMTVMSALGLYEETDNDLIKCNGFYATHNIHSATSGEFIEVTFADELDKHIYKKYIYKKPGDAIEFFDNASKAVGVIFMKFDSRSQMEHVLHHIADLYSVIIR